jgi:hypothetical protein
VESIHPPVVKGADKEQLCLFRMNAQENYNDPKGIEANRAKLIPAPAQYSSNDEVTEAS